MSKNFNLYIFVKTIINVKKIAILQEVMPTNEQIIDHIRLQKPTEKFHLIKIELKKEVFENIYTEIIKLSSIKIKNDFIIICLENKYHPLILIVPKQ